jgi:hydroxymethylbilane synthase
LVIDGHADIAVHSAKDLQALTPEELVIAAFPERGDPRDALVGCRLAQLPPGASVASGSNRRRALLADHRDDFVFAPLRGNMATRLAKAVDHDAIVVAAVALERLAVTPEVVDRLDPVAFVPQVGQGALAVECRADEAATIELLSAINHRATELAVTAERQFLAELGGDCELPAGAHAVVVGDTGSTGSTVGGSDSRVDGARSDRSDRSDGLRVEIRGVLAAPDCTGLKRGVEVGPCSAEPGRVLARSLRKQLEAAG